MKLHDWKRQQWAGGALRSHSWCPLCSSCQSEVYISSFSSGSTFTFSVASWPYGTWIIIHQTTCRGLTTWVQYTWQLNALLGYYQDFNRILRVKRICDSCLDFCHNLEGKILQGIERENREGSNCYDNYYDSFNQLEKRRILSFMWRLILYLHESL